MDGDIYNHGERPSLWERLGALAGHTTYREPVGGRTSRHGVIPADHELCIALGMARRKDDRNDVGPGLAFDIATRSERHKHHVLPLIACAMVGDDGRWRRVIRRNRPFIAVVVADAYMRVIYGHGYPVPDGMDAGEFGLLSDAAEKIMLTLAEEAVDRAARAMRGGA